MQLDAEVLTIKEARKKEMLAQVDKEVAADAEQLLAQVMALLRVIGGTPCLQVLKNIAWIHPLWKRARGCQCFRFITWMHLYLDMSAAES